MEKENNCEHPLRVVETIVLTHYCRICGYQKTITATKEHESEEALTNKE